MLRQPQMPSALRIQDKTRFSLNGLCTLLVCWLVTAAGAQSPAAVLHFDSDQYELTEAAQQTLDSVIARYDFATMKVELRGHTDNTGSARYNHQLSEKRALSAQAYLNGLGLEHVTYSLSNHGEDQPLADNGTVKGRADNRRVEVLVSGVRKPRIRKDAAYDRLYGTNDSESEDQDLSITRDEAGMGPTVVTAAAPKAGWPNETSVGYSNGIQLNVPASAFPNHDLSKLKFKVTQVLNTKDMVKSNFNTVDANGNYLSSAGMFDMSVWAGRQRLEPAPGSEISVSIPAESYDPDMMIYRIVDGKWEVTDRKPQFVDGRYVFTYGGMGGINLDKALPQIVDCMKVTNDQEVVIKVKKLKSQRAQMTFANTNSMIDGERLGRNTYKFDMRCQLDPNDGKVVILGGASKRNRALANRPFSNLRYSKFRKMYILKPHRVSKALYSMR